MSGGDEMVNRGGGGTGVSPGGAGPYWLWSLSQRAGPGGAQADSGPRECLACELDDCAGCEDYAGGPDWACCCGGLRPPPYENSWDDE